MWRVLLVGVLALAGCQGVVGPFDRSLYGQRADFRGVPVDEQHKWGRALYAYPDPNPAEFDAPRTALDPPREAFTNGR